MQVSHFKYNVIGELKVIGWKNIYHAKINQNKDGVIILISNKVDFKAKKSIWNKEGHYMMTKESIQQENLTVLNVYSSHHKPSIT